MWFSLLDIPWYSHCNELVWSFLIISIKITSFYFNLFNSTIALLEPNIGLGTRICSLFPWVSGDPEIDPSAQNIYI